MIASEWLKQLNRIKSDSIHGAGYIEVQLLRLLKKIAGGLTVPAIRRLAQELINWPLPMANVINLGYDLRTFAIRGSKTVGRNELLRLLVKRQKEIGLARQNIAARTVNCLRKVKCVATISHSGVVEQALIGARRQGWRGQVYVAESRPRCEGRNLARTLARHGLDVLFGTDCMIFALVGDVGAVLIGADAVTPKFIVNKIGTSALIKCLPSSRAIYVLAETAKYLPHLENPALTAERLPGEVWQVPPPKVKVLNYHFERVSLCRNMVFINERGTFSVAKMKNELEKQGAAV